MPYAYRILIFLICGSNVHAKSFNFAFQHHESIAISDTDDDLQEEDYDEPGMVEDKENEENKHVRKRRSVKWAPDYDLYEQWAEEYYSQYESPDENPKAILNKPETLLDKIIGHNKTEEELESERLAAAEKKEFILRSFQVFTWIFGGLIIYCCIRNLIRKILDKICCDFCSVFSFKKKITKLVNNFVPGVYIHKNGKKEFYVPTEEELEALKEIQKLLYSVV